MHWGEQDSFTLSPTQMELYFSGQQLLTEGAGSVPYLSSGTWLMPRGYDSNSSSFCFSWGLGGLSSPCLSGQMSQCSLNLSHLWQLILNWDVEAAESHCKDKRIKGEGWISDPDSCSFITGKKINDKFVSSNLGLWFQSTIWKDSQWKWLPPAEGVLSVPKSTSSV